MSKENPKRQFNGSYSSVLTKSQSVQPQYMADQATLAAFDPSLTIEKGQELKSLNEQAMNEVSAKTSKAEIKRKTNAIAEMLKQSVNLYKRLLYFVEKVYDGNSAIETSFGRNIYDKAVHSEKEMVTLLNQATQTARLEEFYARLTENGVNEELLTGMEQLAIDLAAADDEQEMLKKKKLLTTEERLQLYNSIWKYLKEINKAVKIVFANDPVRLKIYKLY